MHDDVFVAFVRAVMHGRDGLHRTVLLDTFTMAGAIDATSYLTTGNVSFRSSPDRLDALRRTVEAGLGAVVSRPTEVFVRSLAELEAIQTRDPFADSPLAVEHERLVTFLPAAPPASLELPVVGFGGEVIVLGAGERELYSVSVTTNGHSRGPGGLIERSLGQRVTTRAWSTVDRILSRLS